jgi:putative PIN family toxin of toxin-antitoxin system
VLRVTADTNIIISALNFSGNPRRVLELAEEGLIHLSISDAILDEVARVLRREKFGWPEDEIRKALNQITRFAGHVDPKQRIDIITEDPTDNRILECAAASGSDYLVSGDKHLLKVGQYQGFKIVPPAEFIEIQAQQGRNR